MKHIERTPVNHYTYKIVQVHLENEDCDYALSAMLQGFVWEFVCCVVIKESILCYTFRRVLRNQNHRRMSEDGIRPAPEADETEPTPESTPEPEETEPTPVPESTPELEPEKPTEQPKHRGRKSKAEPENNPEPQRRGRKPKPAPDNTVVAMYRGEMLTLKTTGEPFRIPYYPEGNWIIKKIGDYVYDIKLKKYSLRTGKCIVDKRATYHTGKY